MVHRGRWCLAFDSLLGHLQPRGLIILGNSHGRSGNDQAQSNNPEQKFTRMFHSTYLPSHFKETGLLPFWDNKFQKGSKHFSAWKL
jgi:hypothetical protein